MIISLICVVGVSYAFFTAGMSSETSTTVRADAGTMKITYSGGANINLLEYILKMMYGLQKL